MFLLFKIKQDDNKKMPSNYCYLFHTLFLHFNKTINFKIERKVWRYDNSNIKLYLVERQTDETMTKGKRTNNDLKSLHKQTKIERHEPRKIKPVVTSERRCSWKFNRSCSELQSIFACLFFLCTGNVFKSNRPNR